MTRANATPEPAIAIARANGVWLINIPGKI